MSKKVEIFFADEAVTQEKLFTQYYINISNNSIDWSHRDIFTPEKAEL